MDLSSIFANFGNDPWANLASVISGGAGLYGGIKSAQNANQVNQGVQQGLGQNTAALQQQIDALNGQITTNRQQAQDMYQRSLADVTGQNQGLQGDIDLQTKNLAALSDPNSPYMQQARAAIERKDAAAGRRSQWGERETQLAGTLAENVSKYSPGIQQSITQARNQINQNNQGLASLYATANNPADRNTMAQIAALQQQLQNVQQQNTTGRQAGQSAVNGIFGTGGVVQSGLGLLGGLRGLFDGGGGGNTGISGYYGQQASPEYGITGYGSNVGSLYGAGGAGSVYDNYNNTLGSAGYGSLPAGNYFGGMTGFAGVPSLQDAGAGYQAPLDFNDPDSGWWD